MSCIAGCAGRVAARPGSLLRVRGSLMRDVAKIVFLGGKGHADNATARVIAASRGSIDVAVPETASSGRLRAVNADGARSAPSVATISIARGARASGALDVQVVGRRVFYDGARPAAIDLLARRPMSLTVVVVRVLDGVVLASWPATLQPGVAMRLTWDGRAAGVPQPPGRYEFRVFNGGPATGAVAAQAPTALATGGFDLVDHRFPVRGRHSFGAGEAAFGAQRDGHVHQGQDVFARCGTPLVAARGGVVKRNGRHAAAGNYLVIDGAGTDVDYAYMHLRQRSPLAQGARVLTGELIGQVGDTGHADGCHLHFELWSGPGWYSGGAPIDPLPALRAWDAYS